MNEPNLTIDLRLAGPLLLQKPQYSIHQSICYSDAKKSGKSSGSLILCNLGLPARLLLGLGTLSNSISYLPSVPVPSAILLLVVSQGTGGCFSGYSLGKGLDISVFSGFSK